MFSYVSIFRHFSNTLFHHHQLLIAHGWEWDKAIFFNLPVVSFTILLDILLWISECRTDWLRRTKMGRFSFLLSLSVSFELLFNVRLYYSSSISIWRNSGTEMRLLKYNAEHTEKKKHEIWNDKVIKGMSDCFSFLTTIAETACCEQEHLYQHATKQNVKALFCPFATGTELGVPLPFQCLCLHSWNVRWL